MQFSLLFAKVYPHQSFRLYRIIVALTLTQDRMYAVFTIKNTAITTETPTDTGDIGMIIYTGEVITSDMFTT